MNFVQTKKNGLYFFNRQKKSQITSVSITCHKSTIELFAKWAEQLFQKQCQVKVIRNYFMALYVKAVCCGV